MTGPEWANDSNENRKTSTPTHGQTPFHAHKLQGPSIVLHVNGLVKFCVK